MIRVTKRSPSGADPASSSCSPAACGGCPCVCTQRSAQQAGRLHEELVRRNEPTEVRVDPTQNDAGAALRGFRRSEHMARLTKPTHRAGATVTAAACAAP